MSIYFLWENITLNTRKTNLDSRETEITNRETEIKKAEEKILKGEENTLNEEERLKLTEKEELSLNGIANKNGINLSEEINTIAHSEAGKNPRLMQVLEAYQDALNQGAYEERLYETFMQNVSKFNYLLPVEKAMNNINEKVDEKREEITLTKLLEMMKDDAQAFIYVDLIQEDVARYVKEPSPINRVQLRNALMPYASDPLINEMFNVLYADNTRRSNELSEKALNIKDQINIIRENATVSNIYSPVQYIKENECVFNVRGQYYVKKGNNIAILDDKYVDQLNEKFVELCQLVNDPRVEINEDSITLYGNDKYATIYEGYVNINGVKESQESLRNLREMCMKYEDYDTNFYIMTSCLLENFNNIAKIDWAKHVTLNENNNINVDLFKLDQNIFMSTHNDALGQHTFYRNINPIYCKNKMNEHMGINVSSLFTDLLPNQDKIILKLNETKNQYETSIEQYEEMIDKLKSAKDSASEENKEELVKAIKDAEEQLADIKDEYKEWQKETANATGTEKSDEEDDDNVKKEVSNEPIDDDEVEAAKAELSTPLSDIISDEVDDDTENTDNFDTEENDEGVNITDDEFAEFIGSNDEESNYAETSDDEDDEDLEVEDDSDEDIYTEEEPEEDIEDKEEFSTISFDKEDKETEDDEDIFEPEESEESEEDEETEEDDATDVFGGDTEDPLGVNNELSVETDPKGIEIGEPEETEEKDSYKSDYSYKIADVYFDENVKDNTKSKSGSVIVIIPVIDGTGKRYVENQTINFYLNDDNMPILNNDTMANDLYAAIVDAIKNHPDYQTVCSEGIPYSETEPENVWNVIDVKDEDDYKEDATPSYYTDDERADAEEDLFTDVIGEDEFVNTAEVKKNLPVINPQPTKEPVIPTYKSGKTEIELPAADVDKTLIPESKKALQKKSLKESIKITPVFKNKKSKKNFF